MSSPGPISPYFVISKTPYGGRGAFVTQQIPKDTLVLSCQAPYASVICKKFRKEVCAWCFAWAWEVTGKNSWNLSILTDEDSEKGKRKKNGGDGGIRFCGEECKKAWSTDGLGETDTLDSNGGARSALILSLERHLVILTRSVHSKPQSSRLSNHDTERLRKWDEFLLSLESLGSDTISAAFLEDAWVRAEHLLSNLTSTTEPFLLKGKGRSKTNLVLLPSDLSEIELDTARFVLSGLVRKCFEEQPGAQLQPIPKTQTDEKSSFKVDVGSWSDVVELQNNELAHARLKPYILASHIRIWAFVKSVVASVLKGIFHPESSSQHHDGNVGLKRTRSLMELLWTFVDTPACTRVILGREQGNVFGIWDMSPEGQDGEMLGWALYPFGSYFNHDCSPTLYKRRKGRTMGFYTLRQVNVGEELCIAYVNERDDVRNRRDLLRREWFFDCGCEKCLDDDVDLLKMSC